MARLNSGDIHARLRAAIDPREPRLVRILVTVRGELRSVLTYQELGSALVDGELTDQALAEWRQTYSQFVTDKLQPEWERQIEVAGRAMAKDVALAVETPFAFSPTGARVLDWIADRAAERVVSWTDVQHDAAKAIIGKSRAEGVGVDELGRRLRAVTGLTPRQAQAVERMREALLADGLSAQDAAKQAQRYSDLLHRQRAVTIARTELAAANNQGQHAAILQAREEGLFGGPVQKVWSTAADERMCDECGGLDGEKAPLDEPFAGGYGLPPIHPMCRCVVQYEVMT